uniref:hypothetical protein n=1 Tax=Thauera sp. SDU_THAU2 TaxID=3136633 RepID=UPI00312037FA
MVVGQRLQAFGRLTQCQPQPAAAEFVDPARALGRAEAIEHVRGGGDLLGHALEQRTASDALAFADEEGHADRDYDQDADQQDQHQAGEQAAGPGQFHGVSGVTTPTSVAST